MADVLCEWNHLDAALAHAEQGLAWLPFWGKADDLALAHCTLARIHMAQANRTGAVKAIEKAVQLTQTSGVFPEAHQAVETAQVRLWLAQGDLQAANRWATSLAERSSRADRRGLEDELAHITRARVWIAQDKPDKAVGLLSRLEKTARPAGRTARVIEIMLLQALARREIGESERALQALAACLALAEPAGYARIFLDEGRPMRLLLAQWLAQAGAGPLRDYALQLLSHFDAEPEAATALQEDASPSHTSPRSAQPLVEPLSPRELDVLRIMALGRTNREIARQLVISTGTVKAHTSSIYRKLDVANRTEAVARARQVGILP